MTHTFPYPLRSSPRWLWTLGSGSCDLLCQMDISKCDVRRGFKSACALGLASQNGRLPGSPATYLAAAGPESEAVSEHLAQPSLPGTAASWMTTGETTTLTTQGNALKSLTTGLQANEMTNVLHELVYYIYYIYNKFYICMHTPYIYIICIKYIP